MGKKQLQNKRYIRQLITFPIHKNKTFHRNLDLFLKLVCAKYSDISSQRYLIYVHQYIAKCRQKLLFGSQKLVVKTLEKIKICRDCDKWVRSHEKTIQCEQCDDCYHKQCVKGNIQNGWICERCTQILEARLVPTKDQKERTNLNPKCAKCSAGKSANKNKKNRALVCCIKCTAYFHPTCFGKNGTVCGKCFKQIETDIKKVEMKQSTLLQHGFRKRQKSEQKDKHSFLNLDQKEEENTMNSLSSRIFRNGYPEMSTQQIAAYKKELLFAIYSKKMEYTEQLEFINCSLEQSNESSLDFQIQWLCPGDFKMYKKYKEQPIGPFHLKYTEKMGYDVIAGKDLPKDMIVCEYIGDVVTFREIIKKYNNDSLMEYRVGRNSDQTLYIRPQKYTNIARYINGINNSTSKDKANVRSFRGIVAGKPAVILYTIKAVKAGQSLVYDYNAGQKNWYPTEDFE